MWDKKKRGSLLNFKGTEQKRGFGGDVESEDSERKTFHPALMEFLREFSKVSLE